MQIQQQGIPVKSSYLDRNGKQEKQLTGKMDNGLSLDNLKESQLKELQLKLSSKKLTLDKVLDKYRTIVEMPGVKYRGSDVLNVLARIEELLGLRDKSAETMTIRALTQSKSSQEITTTLIEITGKTQEYIKKLQEIKTP